MKKNKSIILIIASFILGEIFMFLILTYTPILNNKIKSVINDKVYVKESLKESLKKIYEAVVVVEDYKNDRIEATGTGFIYKKDDKYAYIITNEHVVTEENVKVTLSNNAEEEATILGKDEYLDLAVLRIKKDNVKLVATLGTSEDLELGDTIFTVGTPINKEYRGSITAGVLSGKDRLVDVNVKNQDTSDWLMKVLQIDASINPGNSGGPLLNGKGEVVGICTLKLVDSDIEGMSFAIPIEFAMNYIEKMEKGEEIKWPELGINMANVTDTASIVNNNIAIPNNINDGVMVTEVKKNSSASKSNLKKGDIITEINKNQIKDIAHLRYELYKYKSGDTISIRVMRSNKEKTIKVKLIAK